MNLNTLPKEELERVIIKIVKNAVAKEWLSPEELEAEYGISIHAQNRLRMNRKIPYSKIGKYVRYNRKEIDKWLKEHEIPAMAQ